MNPLQKMFCVLLVVFFSASNVWSWSSFSPVRAFSTHQFLNEKAYEELSKHPAFAGNPFPSLEDIQSYSGIDFSQNGGGPDVVGNSNFSDHWYNPANKQGNAPNKVKEIYSALQGAYPRPDNLYPGQLTISAANSPATEWPVEKMAAYSAHYIQDMTCPMHVSGMYLTAEKLNNLLPKKSKKNLSPYVDSYTDDEWEIIVERYKSSGVDFFDPLYYDSSQEKLTTHFQYEAKVEAKYQLIDKALSGGQVSHFLQWQKQKKRGYIPKAYTRGMDIAELAKKSAELTRKRIGTKKSPGPLWMNADWLLSTLPIPYEDWWRAIQLTYVTWRSSFSALSIPKSDIKLVKVPNQPKQWELQMMVSNLEPEAEAINVEIKVKLDGDIATKGTTKLATIPASGKTDWLKFGESFQITDDPETLLTDLQIDLTGSYRDKKLPDSGEKHILYHAIDIAIDNNAIKMPAFSTTQDVEDIKNLLASAPYNFSVTTKPLGAANTRELANTVKAQIPAANEWVAKGDDIILEVYGDFVDPTANAAAAEVQKLNTELGELHGLALRLSGDICAASSTASATLAAIAEKIKSADKEVETLEDDLHDAEKALRDLDWISDRIESAHGKAEVLTTSLADASSLAEEKRVLVCQAAATMKQSKTNRERDQYYDQAYSGYTESKATFESARVDYRELEKTSGKFTENLDDLTKAQKLTQEMATIPAALLTANNKITSYRQEIDALLETARSNFTQLESVANSAESLGARIKQALNPKTTATGSGASSFFNSLKQLGKKKSAEEIALKKILREISTQVKTAKKCLKKIEKTQKKAQQKADKFSHRFVDLDAKLKKLRQAFLPDATGQLAEPLKSSLEKLHLIDLLGSMGKGYLDRCMEQLLKTSLCKTEAEKLSTVAFSATMPNMVGATCEQATAAVGNYSYQVVSAGKATHPDWEYRVEGTDPASGAEVSLADSSILIYCYEELDIPAYLATVDCSSVEGSAAVYNQATRQAGCDCTDGKIWGQSGQRCLDCSQYENGVRNAFNAGDFNAAQSLAAEASGCSWSASALSQIASAQGQQACSELEGKMQSAYMANDAHAASGFWRQADELNCSLNPGLVKGVRNIVRRHNEMADLQAEAEAQRQRDEAQIAAQQQPPPKQVNWLDVANQVLSGVKAVQERNNQSAGGGSAPAVPSSPDFSDLNNGSKPTGVCQGHSLYCKSRQGLLWEVRKTGYRSLDRNHDGTCDLCKLRIIAPNDCRTSPWKPKQDGVPNEINLLNEVSGPAVHPYPDLY